LSAIGVFFLSVFASESVPKTQKARPVKVWLGKVDDSLAVVVVSGSEFLRLVLNSERSASRDPV
jgi:hypothetical protein